MSSSQYRFFSKSSETAKEVLHKGEEIKTWDDLMEVIYQLQSDPGNKFKCSGLKLAIDRFSQFIQQTEDLNFDFYKDVVPSIVKHAVEVDENDLKDRIKLIEMNIEGEFIIKPRDVRCILANAFLLNISNDIHKSMQKDHGRDFGCLDFKGLYVTSVSESVERLVCQLSYFYLHAKYDLCDNREDIVFTRHHMKEGDEPQWDQLSDVTFENSQEQFKIHSNRMEDVNARSFVDFANRFIHVGAIIPSLTQEEILFSCCPEAFLTLLTCESLSHGEVMTMKGLKRYCDYSGYMETFKFSKLYSPLDNVLDVIIMDATSIKHFYPDKIKRDLAKAYLGFKNCNKHEISTGHWGCGGKLTDVFLIFIVFGGDRTFKFLQQLCAARITNSRLHYSCRGVAEQFSEVLQLIIDSRASIKDLYHLMNAFSEYRATNARGDFRTFLMQELKKKQQ